MTQVIWYRSRRRRPSRARTASAQTSDLHRQGRSGPRGMAGMDASGRYRADWETRASPTRASSRSRPCTCARPCGRSWHARSRASCTTAGSRWCQPARPAGAYRYTNPETQDELQRLVETVVEPLGPTLCSSRTARATWRSWRASPPPMFARRGTYGWNGGWAGDAYLMLMLRQLQPQVVYDETIQTRGSGRLQGAGHGGLRRPAPEPWRRDGTRLPEGGRASSLATRSSAPAIKPDILLPSFNRPAGRRRGPQA